MTQPLEGVKVVEVASLVAGPYCGKLLADLGAQVIKLEMPGAGDSARLQGPFFETAPHREASILFYFMNLGKRGITLDIRQKEGRHLFYRILESCDALIEDIPPGEKHGFGVDREMIDNIKSSPIHLSITALGCTGPNKDYKTHHLNRYMAGGDGAMVFVDHKHLDQPPIQGPAHLADYEAGVGAAIALLGAHFHRLVSGKGQFIDFSIQEWRLMLNGLFLAKHPNENILMDRRKMGYNLGGLLTCKDGHLIIMLLTDHHWWRLIKLMGDPAWALEERFDTQFKRTTHGEELNSHIREWFQNHPKEELYHMLQQAGIPAAPVYSPGEVMGSGQMKARSFFAAREHPQTGVIAMPTIPYRFSRSAHRPPDPAPGLGEHNREVYGELGITDGEMAILHDKGII